MSQQTRRDQKAHQRWWVCERKHPFDSYEAAVDYARMRYPDDPELLAYFCPYSGTPLGRHWHVGHSPRTSGSAHLIHK